jgi:hypothetical protein
MGGIYQKILSRKAAKAQRKSLCHPEAPAFAGITTGLIDNPDIRNIFYARK